MSQFRIPGRRLLAIAAMPDLDRLQHMTARLAPVKLKAGTSHLSPGDRKLYPY